MGKATPTNLASLNKKRQKKRRISASEGWGEVHSIPMFKKKFFLT